MSALTPKKKREIEMLYRKMKEKPSKVFLIVFIDEKMLRNEPTILRVILNLIKRTEGIRSLNHSVGTNAITATAQWT